MNSILKFYRSSARFFSKRYSKDHEWVRKETAPNLYSVGISDHAQGKLGGIVYLSYPEVGKLYKAHDALGEIESPKAVSNIYAPVSIKITEVNSALDADLSVINSKAEDTWLYRGEIANVKELEGLMDVKAYEEYAENN